MILTTFDKPDQAFDDVDGDDDDRLDKVNQAVNSNDDVMIRSNDDSDENEVAGAEPDQAFDDDS